MKIISIRIVVSLLVGFLLAYGAFSFVSWNPNMKTWYEGERLFFIIIFILLSVVSYGGLTTIYGEDNKKEETTPQ